MGTGRWALGPSNRTTHTDSSFRAYLTWYLPRTRARLVFVDTHPQPHQARPQDGYGRHHVEALAGAVSLLIIFAYIYNHIHKIIHVFVILLNWCSFAFATWWRRTARLTWQGYVPDPQWPSLSRQRHGRGSVTSCVQYCTTWEAVCSMKTAMDRPRPRRRSRVRRPRTSRRISITQLQVT